MVVDSARIEMEQKLNYFKIHPLCKMSNPSQIIKGIK